MSKNSNVRILFVCLGNICRSPLAQGLFERAVRSRGLDSRITVDSAGTGDWHIGELPDRRMRATAKGHGVSLDHLRGRKIGPSDLEDFDLILAMDRSNHHTIRMMLANGAADERIRLFRDFDPDPDSGDVPDPYWSGGDGFENVFDIVERTTESLLDWVVERYGLKSG